MPDPTRATISATEAPALFNASPYVTRWMLYHRFASGMQIDAEADSRMTWGRKMQGLIVDHAAEEMRLEVHHNDKDEYVRRGLLGCTRDATIICPDRGPGALETKCIFDYATWMADWNGGCQPPRHVEIQLQQQMLVGDPEFGEVGELGPAYRWGIIAAWVCGEVHYFEREPIPDLWGRLEREAAEFFAEVGQKREPNPFGSPVELPLLRELFPLIKGNTLDLTAHPDGEALALTAREYRAAKEQESAGKATGDPLRAQLLAAAKSADEVLLPGAVVVRIRKSGAHNGRRITVWWPAAADTGAVSLAELRMAG